MSNDFSTQQGNPEVEYNRRLELLRATATLYKQRDTRLTYVKLIVLVAGVVMAIWILASVAISINWVLVPGFLLLFVAVIHERVIRTIRRCSRVIVFYEHALARMGDQWAGTGETGERFADPSHPYSRDLDLFGKGSLFELLCTARTRAGQETMAGWLLAPAPPDEVCLRHAAVCELRSKLDLREDLAVLGEDVRSGMQPEWGENGLLFRSTPVRVVLPLLAFVWLFGIIAWAVWDIRALVLLASLVNLSISYKFDERAETSIASIEGAARELSLLSKVLARLERETFSAPRLVALQSDLQRDGLAASRCIARLSRLVDGLISRRNPILEILDRFVFWSLQLSFAIEAWRSKFGKAIRPWLGAVGEMEALSALAGYAYEHPGAVFPEFVETAPCFDAEGLAHPLIPEKRVIRNDLKLGEDLRLIIISGPNMAGKSTLLRAIGVNAVLAQCGAPVCARRLRLSRLTVAASVCILDSLQGGISRFYAEISRLKLIADLTSGPFPVLFLLDELLQGTNSHDRRIGAEAIVRRLFERRAIGLITTHDLALAEIADSLGRGAANFHFEDHLENGRLHFDYHLSPGIVRTSNALDLMRSIGLEV